jgi:FKBP-type peptidyl-prolyl cis-trans isomerase FklB
MKYRVTVAATMIASLGGVSFAEETVLKTDEDKVGYSIGYQIGGDFKQQGISLKPDMLSKGVQDALAGAQPAMKPDEMEKTMSDLRQRVAQAQQEAQKNAGEKNLTAGKAFLDENAKKQGVTTLPSGLQYSVETEGTGAKPKATDTVTVHYRGTLTDGTEFDSSYTRGKPAEFRVDQVIKGWTEALQLMKQGSKWKIVIPSALAYGERGAGPIGPNSVLLFDVELLGINEPEKKAGEPPKKAAKKAK